jgi:HSP20 family protein
MEQVKVNKQQSVAKPEAAPLRRANEFFAPMVPFGRWFGMSPFALMRELTDEMDKTFRGVAPAAGAGAELRAWSPVVDIRQCNGDLVVTAELPGLKKDEVKVEVTDDALVIQGERKREHKEDHEGYHSYERSYGQFYRSIALPEGAKTDQVKAEMQDGILKVSVPVPQAEKKSRQVPIEAKTATAKA